MKETLLSILFMACLFSCSLEKLHEEVEINSSNPPLADFQIVNNNCVAACEVSFVNNSSGANTYLWDFGNNSTSTDFEPSHIFNLEGSYPVKLTVSNLNGQKDSITNVVTIQEVDCPVEVSFDVVNNNCKAPCTIDFANTSQNANTYSWDFGNGETSTLANPSITYSTPGEYQIQLTASDGNCDESFFTTISIRYNTFEKTYGGANHDTGHAVLLNEDNNIVIVGETLSQGAGDWDAYYLRIDIFGNLVDEDTYGGVDRDAAYGIAEADGDGYWIGGITKNGGIGEWDFYLIRASSFGASLAELVFGGTANDELSTFKKEGGGNLMIGSTTSNGALGYDIYFVRRNISSGSSFEKTYGGAGNDRGLDIIYTSDGGYLICGYTTSLGAGFNDVYIIKTDQNGEQLWDKTFGGANPDEGIRVLETNDGGYIILSYSSSLGDGNQYLQLIKTSSTGDEE